MASTAARISDETMYTGKGDFRAWPSSDECAVSLADSDGLSVATVIRRNLGDLGEFAEQDMTVKELPTKILSLAGFKC